MKIFPIGTSRLHEPLTLIDETLVEFPRMGYFHSTSQILDCLKIITGDITLNAEQAKLFFRKDQVECNKFDLDLWTDNFCASVDRIRQQFENADTLFIEISAHRSYKLNNLHIQGNPNYYQDVSYADIWKDGYYQKYMPALNVLDYEDTDLLIDNLISIDEILLENEKKAIIFGHLVNSSNPNKLRLKTNTSLQQALKQINTTTLIWYDQTHLVDQFGFRVLDNGTVDIHHLPWDGLYIFIDELIELANFKD